MPTHRLPSIKPIERLIRRTRAWLRTSWVATGLAATLAAAFGAVLVTAMLDLLITLWPVLRWVALAAVVAPTAVLLIGGVAWPAVRRLTSRHVARRIENHIPQIHNRLVSCVDLAVEGTNHAGSPAFRRRLIEESLDRIRNFRIQNVLDLARLRRMSFAAAAAIAAFLLVAILLSDRLPTAMARVFRPWADIPPASGVFYTVLPGDAKVLRGDDLELLARVEKGEPDDLHLDITPDGGRPIRYEMRRRDAQLWTFTLRGFETSFSYRVVGGGTWSLPHRVTVLERPRLVSLQATLHWPKYLGTIEPRANPPQEADIAGPETSEIEVTVGIEGDASRGEVRFYREGPKKELIQAAAFPMQPAGSGKWSGRFPLNESGFYRVHLENDLGAANQTMKEGKLTAIPDRPPQIVLERPTGEMTLSAPQKVPLVVSAFDDFALDDITLLVRKGDTGSFRGTPVKKYSGIVRNDAAIFPLDLEPYALKPGEHIRYCVQARDRKGQVDQTPEFIIRLAADPNAADKQMAAMEKTQDQFQEQLVKLIAEQAKVHQGVEQVAAKYEPLDKEIRQAKIEAQQKLAADLKLKTEPPLQLNPETAKKLEALRQELARLAGQEQQNAAQAQQLTAAMAQSVEQAAKLQLLPAELLSEMRETKNAMNENVAQPMQQATGDLQKAAKEPTAQEMEDLQRQQKRLDEELESILKRLKALKEARAKLGTDADETLARLRDEMAQQQAMDQQRQLEDLQNMLAGLEKQLGDLEDRQADYLDNTAKLPAPALPEMENKQSALEQEAAGPLAEAQELLQPEKPRRMKREPKFPDAPYQEQGEEYMVPPKEEDTPAPPDKTKKDAATKSDAKPKDKAKEEEEEPLYEPVLGGPVPKLDPRFADKRPSPKPASQEPGEPGEKKREELRSREFHKLTELDMARQSVAADARTLERLRSEAQQGQQPSAMQQALAMAQRMQAARASRSQASQRAAQPRGPSQGAGLRIVSRGVLVDEKELEKRLHELDPATRTVILKMQPRVREEILQGMREEGPEGYRAFIREYFQRLTEVGEGKGR
jgi:hypothetical protein